MKFRKLRNFSFTKKKTSKTHPSTWSCPLVRFILQQQQCQSPNPDTMGLLNPFYNKTMRSCLCKDIKSKIESIHLNAINSSWHKNIVFFPSGKKKQILVENSYTIIQALSMTTSSYFISGYFSATSLQHWEQQRNK